MTYSLSEGQKQRIRERLINGSRNYKNHLMNKYFSIVCEDGSIYEVCFFKDDFKHLSGLCSNLNNSDFFNECVKGHFSITNIKPHQKYNWSTLNHKTKCLEELHSLLYQDCDKTLAINTLTTSTTVFPIAVKDVKRNMCIGFVSNINRARSLRKASNSSNPSPGAEKTIIAIFERSTSQPLYNGIVYMHNVSLVQQKCPDILANKLTPELKDRFSYIITF